MKHLQILPIGPVDAELLEWLAQALHDKFRVPTEILPPGLDPAFALHVERQQYHSSEILAGMQRYINGNTWRLLGVTQLDLYIPILTFVFGEAQLSGTGGGGLLPSAAAGVLRIAHRHGPAGQSPSDRVRTRVGHTLRLTHCHDYQCAMAASHAVEWIDIKDSGFCEDCLARALGRRFS